MADDGDADVLTTCRVDDFTDASDVTGVPTQSWGAGRFGETDGFQADCCRIRGPRGQVR